VLQVGQQLDLFDAFLEAQSAEETATTLNLEKRYVELWCQAAASFRLLEKRDGKYQTSETYRDWLLNSKGFTQTHLHLGRRMNETISAVFSGRALPEPPISLRLLLQEHLIANYNWLFAEASRVCPALGKVLAEGNRVLEVGCGVGFGLSYLRDFHPHLELFGLEADYECAEEAERSTKAVIHVGEFPAERFAGNFDLVVNFRSVTASPDPKRLLSECASLLKKDGLLLLSSEMTDESERRKSQSRVLGERLAYNVLAGPSLVNSFTRNELAACLESGGFKVEAELSAPDWATPTFVCSPAT